MQQIQYFSVQRIESSGDLNKTPDILCHMFCGNLWNEVRPITTIYSNEGTGTDGPVTWKQSPGMSRKLLMRRLKNHSKSKATAGREIC